ncbi:MAG: undecaprenyl/decaprenyl-phosphate alpha-N-acetylglucosaminyl 1-phosphate transferase [Bacteroidales bacterium]|nr:undecaprenyl/decaprenyl-phosphate alpha-N-acetylglucosaminyl 1-phosphate transferase [Candidatus Sodaliphilus fimicaballi]
MMNIIFLVAIILAFVMTWFLMPIVIKYAVKRSIIDQPNERKIHEGNIPRIGGVVFVPIALFLSLVALFPVLIQFIPIDVRINFALQILAILLLFVVGCIDDIKGLRYRNKFIAQFISGVLLCCSDLYITNLHGVFGIYEIPEMCGWAITVFAVIYCTNAFNFIDGVDGQAALLAITAFVYYGFVLMSGSGIIYIPICVIMIVCLMVYLRYNVWGNPENQTKTFMGDAGSLSLGCLILILGCVVNSTNVIDESQGVNVFIKAFAPLFLPCLDVVRVVIHRSREGRNLFEADKNHIHHKLLAYGWSPNKVSMSVCVMNVVIILLSIVMARYLNCNIVIIVLLALWTALNMWLTKSIMKNKRTMI